MLAFALTSTPGCGGRPATGEATADTLAPAASGAALFSFAAPDGPPPRPEAWSQAEATHADAAWAFERGAYDAAAAGFFEAAAVLLAPAPELHREGLSGARSVACRNAALAIEAGGRVPDARGRFALLAARDPACGAVLSTSSSP